MEVGGVPVPLAAIAATQPDRSQGRLRSRGLTFQLLDAPEPGGVAVLQFGRVNQIKRGVECKWTTAAR